MMIQDIVEFASLKKGCVLQIFLCISCDLVKMNGLPFIVAYGDLRLSFY